MSNVKPGQPDTLNPIYTNNFQFRLSRIPSVVFYCQSASIPSMSITPIVRKTSLAPLREPANIIEFAPLSITFLVDQNLQNWNELKKWMFQIAPPTNHQQAAAYPTLNSLFSDADLLVLNSQKVPTASVKFKDCWPSFLDQVDFAVTQQNPTQVNARASFLYSTFDIELLN